MPMMPLLSIRLLLCSLRCELAIVLMLQYIINGTYVVMEVRAVRGLVDVALPDDKVTKVLAFVSPLNSTTS